MASASTAEITVIAGLHRITTSAAASSRAPCVRNGRITYIGYTTALRDTARQASKTRMNLHPAGCTRIP